MPICRCSKTRRSPSSATARRDTPTPRTCAIAAARWSSASVRAAPNYDLAKSHGFEPVSAEEATKQADLVNMLLPDEVQGDTYRQSIKPHLKPGNMLMCSHGFNVHFGQVEAPHGGRYGAGGPERSRPPGAQRVRKRGRRAVPDRLESGRERRTRAAWAWPMPKGIGGTPRRRDRDHVCRGDRNRLVRRAGRAVRRRQRAGEGRLRDARRGRVSARDGVFRVHARAEANRRPVLPRRFELHALQRVEHGRIRRLHARAANRDRRNARPR